MGSRDQKIRMMLTCTLGALQSAGDRPLAVVAITLDPGGPKVHLVGSRVDSLEDRRRVVSQIVGALREAATKLET